MATALVLVRACQFWAVAVLLGGGGLSLLGARPRRGMPLLRLAAVAAVLSGMAWLALTLVGMTEDAASLANGDDWRAFFAQPPFGPAWAARLALFAAGVAILPVSRAWPYTIVGLGLALDGAWLGHAGAGVGAAGVEMVAAYWAHVLAGFAWVGALTMLAALLVEQRDTEVAAALALFSTIGIGVVALVLASGVFNAAEHLRAVSDLVDTAYGRLVALKLALVLGMVGLAAFNRTAARRAGIVTRRLAIAVALEASLGMLVIAVAAVLGITPPP